MALIQCPECGKENVSDSAQACPECGYGIKAHFDEIKQEREEKEQEEKRRKELEEIKAKREEEEKIEIASMPDPVKPFPWQPLAGVLWLGMGIFHWTYSSYFFALVFFFFAFVFIVGGTSMYIEKKQIYETSLCDMEKAKKQALNAAAENERNYKNVFKGAAGSIKCPMCGNYAGKKLSTANRAVSVATVGLASGKIGKQYKCTRCGHMW